MFIIHGSGTSVTHLRSIPSGLTVPSIKAPNEACLAKPMVSLSFGLAGVRGPPATEWGSWPLF